MVLDHDSTTFKVLKFSIGGMSCGVASTLTNPLDVVRIRLQNQVAGSGTKDGMVSGLKRIVAEEGMRGLTRGLYASWAREITYSSARIGLYDPARDFVSGGETDPSKVGAHVKFVAGFISGSIGSAACNPCDFIKTRQQKVIPITDPTYHLSNWNRHVLEVRSVLATDGVVGLYKGWQATSARAAVLTSAQLGSYDTCKNNFAKPLLELEEGIALHLASSLAAAVFTTTASNPFDVVKTRYMCDTTGQYAGKFIGLGLGLGVFSIKSDVLWSGALDSSYVLQSYSIYYSIRWCLVSCGVLLKTALTSFYHTL